MEKRKLEEKKVYAYVFKIAKKSIMYTIFWD